MIHIYNGVLLRPRKEWNWVFVEMWIDLEPVIKSEVSQKGKNKCHMLMYICQNQKNSTDEPICSMSRDTDIESRHVDSKGRGRWDEQGD